MDASFTNNKGVSRTYRLHEVHRMLNIALREINDVVIQILANYTFDRPRGGEETTDQPPE